MLRWQKQKTAIVLQKVLLFLICGTLLSWGSELLIKQIRIALFNNSNTQLAQLHVKQSNVQPVDLHGAFPVDSVNNYTVRHKDKDVFSLLCVHYRDNTNQQRRAILFPDTKQIGVLPDSIAVRQNAWQEAAKSIKDNAPKDALILSWWDDGQRIHFLSGRDTWLNKPVHQTFVSPIWKSLQNGLLVASDTESKKLTQMAHWLTMYSDAALIEMRQFFGASRPIYLLVTNDLLLHLEEMVNYGGQVLSLKTKAIIAHDNLHGDITQIKQWANESGDGNYLVQKEGGNYHAWVASKLPQSTKNSLLIRLLPFVDSLKQLPQGVHLVYQSHWGAYLSIYRIDST